MKDQMKRVKNNITDKSALYLVSTPIGNLDDISIRAIKTLENVDFILCEDTRVSGKLLSHFEIKKELVSYHEHNKDTRNKEIINRLLLGETAALISDAGMPVISDPGYELVNECISNDIPVIPLPGANAALTTLIASGVAPKPFTYFGFLSQKEAKKIQELESLKYISHTIILYESVHRLISTLESINEVLGNRYVVVGRELTKQHEEFTFGQVKDILSDPPKLKGELVIVIQADKEEEITKPIIIQVQELVSLGIKPMDAIKQVAKSNNIKKQEVYMIYEASKKE